MVTSALAMDMVFRKTVAEQIFFDLPVGSKNERSH